MTQKSVRSSVGPALRRWVLAAATAGVGLGACATPGQVTPPSPSPSPSIDPPDASTAAPPYTTSSILPRRLRAPACFPSLFPDEAVPVAEMEAAEAVSRDMPGSVEPSLRLARLAARQEGYVNAEARRLDEKIFDLQAGGDSAEAQHMRDRQRRLERTEMDWLKVALKSYLTVTQNRAFQGFARADEVLYELVFYLVVQQREDLARPIMKRLLTDYPDSPHIPHAYLMFGEYFLAERRPETAMKFYDKVLQFGTGGCFDFARQRRGEAEQALGAGHGDAAAPQPEP